MILTPKQQQAINIIKYNYDRREPITVILGYAGSGKSSIINYFINEMDLNEETVFCTFTGKASLVLRKQGLPSKTIHSLIYNAYKNKHTGKFIFKLKPILDEDYKLIVVDEISMVPKKLLDDLLSFNVPIVALGDPGQLPPIVAPNGLMENPDYFLDEIHRQAADNSIIKVSMLVREGKPLPLTYNDPFVKIIKRSDLELGMLFWADQVICAKNATRRDLNQQMRNDLGFTEPLPVTGDKLICLKNHWDVLNRDEYPLINGTIGFASNINIGTDFGILGQRLVFDFEPDYNPNPFTSLAADSNIFKGLAPISQDNKRNMLKLHEFDFGYAITTHKSQGSSFEKVLFYEEKLRSSKEDHIKLVYTAITRATTKLIIVKEN